MAETNRLGLTILINLLFLTNIALTFNVDTAIPEYFSNNENGSFFGYSIAFNRYELGLMIGAPLSKEAPSGSGGALYRCGYNKRQDYGCAVVKNADVKEGAGDDRQHQWLGATVSSNNRITLACAPRFANRGTSGNDFFLLGKCVNILEKDSSYAWKPCAARFCQAGFSACYFGSNTQKQSSILSGVPVQALSVENNRGRLAIAPQGGASASFTPKTYLNYSDYMGYAVTSGKFHKDKNTVIVVGGSPRGNELGGKVIMYFTDNGSPVFSSVINDPSKQTGTYFGSALAAVAIDKVKVYADLVVGAPFFAGSTVNEGIVYVYKNNKQNSLELVQRLYGEKQQGAMFGYAIGSVGDLNQDNYNDIAVGAPWGGENGKGVVYLYYGSANNEPFLLKQTLYASKLDNKLDGFGFSFADYHAYKVPAVSANILNDVDNNNYPDLAVGSYRSNHVVLFKSRPVIDVLCDIKGLDGVKIDLYDLTDMCTNPVDKKKYKCITSFDVCFTLTNSDKEEAVNYTVVIDSEKKAGRRGFIQLANGDKVSQLTGVLEKVKTVTCITPKYVIYLYNNTKDINKEMYVKVSWLLQPGKDCTSTLCPIANEMSNLKRVVKIHYIKGCSGDGNNVCNTKLSIKLGKALEGGYETIQVGVTKVLNITATIKNKGENAFDNNLRIGYPKEVNPNKVVIKNFAGTPVWDPNINRAGGQAVVGVTLPSPIAPNEEYVVSVEFGVARVSKGTERLTFEGWLKTESEEMEPADNNDTLTIPVALIANLTVTGNVVPEQIKWDSAAKADKVGPEVVHTFYFQNLGPSTADTSDVVINFPLKYEGQIMFNIFKAQLEGSDKTKSAGTCAYGKLNPLGLDVTTSQQGSGNVTAKKLRTRREVDSSIVQLGCGGSVECREIKCSLGLLKKSDGVTLKITSNLVASTFQQKVKDSRIINVQAKFTSTAVDKPKNAAPDTVIIPFTALTPNLTKEEDTEFPYWIVIVCILAAILIIAIIVFIMYKKGFFKRKKMGEEEEEEGLRGNEAED
ncbi:integrin alpha-V-like isoform X2 [Hydractinia symbiolongicarpus]|uniref:integrin alpha-V-like isoform X2 n=1 Tax=Hydractinia symbiolongicarpus TaxID=13093 RepID=UPI00254CB337|nr:integrin alpha-V-like isoform X2 [Hydractinia symbiolongicarpus]